MKKISTVVKNRNKIFKEPQLTIGLDLGDRSSHYCILDEAGSVILEHNLPTTPKGIHQVFSRIPRSRIALETGTHSPWVSRQLTELGHEVIVAHARNVRLIGESSRKDDQLDARTLARLARIDPDLLGPVRHRSAKAQIHLTVIRARAALVQATGLLSTLRAPQEGDRCCPSDHRGHRGVERHLQSCAKDAKARGGSPLANIQIVIGNLQGTAIRLKY